MRQAKYTSVLVRSVLLGLVAACADLPSTPGIPGTPATDGEAAPSFSREARSPRDVPAVRIDLPPTPRPWDGDPAALARVLASGGGYAVVAFKEPGSARALATGHRGAVTAGTVRAGLQLLERSGVEVLELLDAIGAARVRLSPDAAAELHRHPLVDFIEPRQYGSLQAQTRPFGIGMVNAPNVWFNHTGTGAKVQIIDTGHQQGHPDLPAVPNANCAGVNGGCDDSAGINHGTHVLGIVAALDNMDGVVGMAPGIAGPDVFVYGACVPVGITQCPTEHVTAGINAGIGNGVHVINLSLTQPYDMGQAAAVALAADTGIVIVAAAGNNSSNTFVYPAGYTDVIGVSGVNNDRSFAASGTTACTGYSNYGSHVDLAAPFHAYSTVPFSTYGADCGTSMAAPHVTGAVALLKSENPAWTNQQIVERLFAMAEDRGTAGRDDYYGYGVLRLATVWIHGGTRVTQNNTLLIWKAFISGLSGPATYKWEYRVQGTTAWTLLPSTTYIHGRVVNLTDPDFEIRVTATASGLSVSDTHLIDVVAP
jgi:subtilisin family serine protease